MRFIVLSQNLPQRAGTFPKPDHSVPTLIKSNPANALCSEVNVSRQVQIKEQVMKLNATQVKQALSQFEAQVLPDDHPAATQLSSIYGDQTFFLDDSGLKVLEPVGEPAMEAQTGEIVSLADWSDATLTSLRPHEPEMTGVVVVLEMGPVRH